MLSNVINVINMTTFQCTGELMFFYLNVKYFYFVLQMLKKIRSEESLRDNSSAELDALKHRDWVRQSNCTHIVTGQYHSVFT